MSALKRALICIYAGMAELADAHGSGPCGSNTMRVQVSFPAYRLDTLPIYGRVFCIFVSVMHKKMLPNF